MKRFHFQLETALDWRRRRMEQEQFRWEEMQSHHAALTAQLDIADQNFAESRKATLESPVLLAADLSALAEYRDAVELRKQRLRREATKLEAEMAQQRIVVVDATRQFRLLEKLRDRRMEEWRKGCDRELEIEAGDLYLAKWNRDGGDG
jgi:flagellar export protein FliJ